MARRRKRGTGSIPRQRKDGLWVGQVSLGTRPDGKRDRRSFSSRRKTDVEFWIRETTRRYRVGDDVNERLTLSAYLDDWLATVTPTVRPTTARGYAIHIDKWIRPVIGTRPLIAVRQSDVAKVTAAVMRGDGRARSPRTAGSVLTTLRMVLRAAVHDGHIERNPAEAVKPPRAPAKPAPVIDRERAKAILAAFDGHPMEPLVTVAMGTGMRLGELLALRWTDATTPSIRVHASLRPVPRTDGKGYRLDIVEPKTRRSIRVLEPGPFVWDALDRQRRRQTVITPYVFTTDAGEWLDPRNVTRSFQLRLRQAGLPAMRFHDLRHAYATLSLAAGVPLRVVQEALGHTSIALTAAVYAHVLPELQRDAGKRLDDALFGS